ncbi:MAG: carboxypeptidase-like regulatory domain-containing protein [Acidobacteriaceae bacterium]
MKNRSVKLMSDARCVVGATRKALCFVASMAFLLVCTQAGAQVDAGAVVGVVRDPGGALVAGSNVTLKAQDSGQVTSTVTNSSGEYTFSPVKIGTYIVTVEASGFKKIEHTNVTVSVQQNVLVDFVLTTGTLTETVSVTGDAPQLQTQDASVGQVIGTKTINDLPLNGRNFTFLAQLSAGVTQNQNDTRGLGATGSFAANGARPAQNNYLLDGIDNNSNLVDFLNGTAYAVLPPPDAIQEFKIQTSNYSAEIGRSAGAVLNATIKTGTNSVHGSVWEFVRNDVFDANNYFNKHQAPPKPIIPKGGFSQNQFGFTLGGPIKKNKTFLFGDYQGFRNTQAKTQLVTVPSALERSSSFTNFSQLLTQGTKTNTDALGRVYLVGQVFDPATTRAVICGVPDVVTGILIACGAKPAGTNVGFARTPFANNMIPAGRLDANAIKLLNLYPAPTDATALTGNFLSNRQGTNNSNSYDVRLDQFFTAHDSAFARFSYLNNPQFVPGPFDGLADGGDFGSGTTASVSYNAALNETHTFSATLINEFRAGVNRLESSRLQPGAGTQGTPAQFGIMGIPQNSTNGGLPKYTIANLAQLGSVDFLPSVEFSTVVQFSDDITKTLGHSTIKFGYSFERLRFSVLQPAASRGLFAFSGNYTDVPNQTSGNTGIAQFVLSPTPASVPGGADQLGGFDSVRASDFANTDTKRNYNGAYYQQDFKLSPTLTLNAGLRYEVFGPQVELYGHQTNFQPSAGPTTFLFAQKTCDTPLSPTFLANIAADNVSIKCSDQPGLQSVQHNNFSPRMGIAYQITPRLVTRAGYGIFYGGFENSSQFTFGDFPFQFTLSYNSQTPNTPTILPDGTFGTLESGLSHVALLPSLVNSGASIQGEDFHIRSPYNQNYNWSFQYQLSQNQSLQVGYVGNVTRHLGVYIAPNRPSRILPPGQNSLANSPYPHFASGGNFTTFSGTANYNSLQLTYEHRLAQGLSVLANFTYSKCITDARDYLNATSILSYRAATLVGFGIAGDTGPCDYDIPRVTHVSGIYELPFGRDRMFAKGAGRFLDAAIGGWSTNFILTVEDGQPGTVRCSVTTTTTFGCYAFRVAGVSPYNTKANSSRVNNFLDPAGFANAPVATVAGQTDFSPLGGAPSQYRGPAFRRLDFSLFKNIRVTERVRAEFRAEAFNLTNTPNFANPSTTNLGNTSTFGQITTLRDGVNDPRELQFAIKASF